MTRVLIRRTGQSLVVIFGVLVLSLPNIFAGAVIAESVFNFPGMGDALNDIVSGVQSGRSSRRRRRRLVPFASLPSA